MKGGENNLKILDKIENFLGIKNEAVEDNPIILDFFQGGKINQTSDIGEITYFTCIKTLSESLGKLPIYLIDDNKNRVYNHDTVELLTTQPNSVNTPIQFFTYLEYCRNHYGNAYVYIENDKNGKFKSLYPLNPRFVTVQVNNSNKFTEQKYFYQYTDPKTQKAWYIMPEEMIHVKSWITTPDGLVGRSVREILATSMQGSKASQDFLNKLYQNGLTANAVIKYVGDLSEEAQLRLLSAVERQAKDNDRRLITLPIGFDISTLDLKLTDSQFYELKKYNSLQIASAFGLKPNHLNDYSKSSYANSASQNLSFYIDTLLYNVTLYEQEFNRKLLTKSDRQKGLKYKFNVAVILRGDPSQQAEIIQKLVMTGVYSINDARNLLDFASVENGDVHVVNGSMVDIKDIGIAYKSKGVKE